MGKIICFLLMSSLASALVQFKAIPIKEVMQIVAQEHLRSPRDVEALRGSREATHTNSKSKEYVDFGAHTGARGSYGWYVDYPVRKSVLYSKTN